MALRTMAGADLIGATYEPPFPWIPGAHRVLAGDFVTTEDGSEDRYELVKFMRSNQGTLALDRAWASLPPPLTATRVASG